MPCATLSPEYPSDPIRPDYCGRVEKAPREAYVTSQPFFATAMTLGEFRSCHHHAGYDGFDSERGFLVELPAGAVAEVPSQPPPKVWIDADTFARTYHRPLALDALNVLRDRNGLSPIAPPASVNSQGPATRTYRGGIDLAADAPSLGTYVQHDVFYQQHDVPATPDAPF